MSFISRFITYGTPCSPAPSSALPSATPPVSKPTGLTWLKSISVSTVYGWWGQMVSTCSPEAKHLARASSCITGVIRSKLYPRPQNSKINTMDSVGGHRGRWWWWGHCPVVAHRCSLLPTGSGKVGGHVVSIFSPEWKIILSSFESSHLPILQTCIWHLNCSFYIILKSLTFDNSLILNWASRQGMHFKTSNSRFLIFWSRTWCRFANYLTLRLCFMSYEK